MLQAVIGNLAFVPKHWSLCQEVLAGNNRLEFPPSLDTTGYQRHTIFSNQEEMELDRYLLAACDIYYGLTPSAVRELAYQYAEVFFH